jgi:hypothetical protein
MNSSNQQPCSSFDASPTTCFLSKILYCPSPNLVAIAGFALFEARDEPRRVAIQFAPDLSLADSIAAALEQPPIRDTVNLAQPRIRSLIASFTGPDPQFRPDRFDIPGALRVLPPMCLATFSFEKEMEHLSQELFREVTLWAKLNNYTRPKKWGVAYLRRALRRILLNYRVWKDQTIERQIPVGNFISNRSSFRIYLAYKDLRYGIYRMLHPVSIARTNKNAKALASNWPRIKAGIEAKLQMKCEMRAIVESAVGEAKESLVSRQKTMEDAGIIVFPESSLHALAADAQAALLTV